MYEQFAILAIFLGFAVGFVVVNVAVLSWFLRPRVPGAPEKTETYECGEPAIGEAWVRFDIRFYTTALIFIIFEVEVAFLFPWAAVFQDLKAAHGGYVLSEVFAFVGVLVLGLIYAWAKGDLDWVKSTVGQSAGALPPGEGATDGRSAAGQPAQ